jgi:hypothetical protein
MPCTKSINKIPYFIKRFIPEIALHDFRPPQSCLLDFLTPDDGPKICPETSKRNYHSAPRKIKKPRSLISSTTSWPLHMWPERGYGIITLGSVNSQNSTDLIAVFLEARGPFSMNVIIYSVFDTSFHLLYFAASNVTACSNYLIVLSGYWRHSLDAQHYDGAVPFIQLNTRLFNKNNLFRAMSSLNLRQRIQAIPILC